MTGLTTHLFRRGLSVAADHYPYNETVDGENKIKLSPAGIATVAITILFFSLWLFTIKYSYGMIVPTLAIVESPQTEVLVEVDVLDGSDQSKKVLEPDVMMIRTKPVTAKIRTAIMHLRAKAGYWSRFRGLSLFVLYSFFSGAIVHLVTATVTRALPGRMLAHFIASILLARFEMTWVHIVISEPSSLAWYKRVPRGWKPLKNILPAAALKSAATQIVMILPAAYACNSTLSRFHQTSDTPMTEKDARAILIDSIITLTMYLALVVLIEIPATVTFVRVAASMLPEQDESIVPFDRTFNGKVTPEIVGGAGKVGILEAWRSFDRSSRIRLLKLVSKVVAVQVVVMMISALVVVGELRLFMGKDFEKMIQAARAGSN